MTRKRLTDALMSEVGEAFECGATAAQVRACLRVILDGTSLERTEAAYRKQRLAELRAERREWQDKEAFLASVTSADRALLKVNNTKKWEPALYLCAPTWSE